MDERPDVTVQRAAVLSEDRRYRYRLERTWAPPEQPAVFVMLNPSVADGSRDDQTIRRCIHLARSWGHGALVVVNLYALVTTDPRALWNHPAPVGGALNDEHVAAALQDAGIVVAAWGAHARPHRVEAFRYLAARSGTTVMHLGLTQSGAPRHPLARVKSTAPQLWFDPAHDDVVPPLSTGAAHTPNARSHPWVT